MLTNRVAANAAEAARRLAEPGQSATADEELKPLVTLLRTVVEDLGGHPATSFRVTRAGS